MWTNGRLLQIYAALPFVVILCGNLAQTILKNGEDAPDRIARSGLSISALFGFLYLIPYLIFHSPIVRVDQCHIPGRIYLCLFLIHKLGFFVWGYRRVMSLSDKIFNQTTTMLFCAFSYVSFLIYLVKIAWSLSGIGFSYTNTVKGYCQEKVSPLLVIYVLLTLVIDIIAAGICMVLLFQTFSCSDTGDELEKQDKRSLVSAALGILSMVLVIVIGFLARFGVGSTGTVVLLLFLNAATKDTWVWKAMDALNILNDTAPPSSPRQKKTTVRWDILCLYYIFAVSAVAISLGISVDTTYSRLSFFAIFVHLSAEMSLATYVLYPPKLAWSICVVIDVVMLGQGFLILVGLVPKRIALAMFGFEFLVSDSYALFSPLAVIFSPMYHPMVKRIAHIQTLHWIGVTFGLASNVTAQHVQAAAPTAGGGWLVIGLAGAVQAYLFTPILKQKFNVGVPNRMAWHGFWIVPLCVIVFVVVFVLVAVFRTTSLPAGANIFTFAYGPWPSILAVVAAPLGTFMTGYASYAWISGYIENGVEPKLVEMVSVGRNTYEKESSETGSSDGDQMHLRIV